MAELLEVEGYEEVYRVPCGSTVAFVALHAVLSGRSFGGIRIRPYPSEAAALRDALALSKAMSRKCAMAGIGGGGAKCVLIEPPRDRAAAVRDLGVFIESLGGRYWSGPDLGFTPEDLATLRTTTKQVSCGDDAAYTSRTVQVSMMAALSPRRVAIQGLGAAGRPLAEMLQKEGVQVIAADPRGVDRFESVPPDSIYDVEADVFSPCAVGGVLDAASIDRLKVKLVCGAANNPFATEEDPERLRRRGIDYVPDFIANSGALIHGASIVLAERHHVEARIQALTWIVPEILDRARREERSPHVVAVEMADAKIAAMRG